MDRVGQPLNILTVCTGNICRSPAAERFLAAALGDVVSVTSAGTAAVVGHGIEGAMARLMERDGLSSDGFKARQLREEQIREADLVLALTRDHRSQVVDILPAAVRRTFTLREFAWLLRSVDDNAADRGRDHSDRLRQVLPALGARRASHGLPDDALNIADPFGGADAAYESSYALIRASVLMIVDWFELGKRPAQNDGSNTPPVVFTKS